MSEPTLCHAGLHLQVPAELRVPNQHKILDPALSGSKSAHHCYKTLEVLQVDPPPEHDVDEGAPVHRREVNHQPIAWLQVGNAGAHKHYKRQDDEERHPNGHSSNDCQASVVEIGQND